LFSPFNFLRSLALFGFAELGPLGLEPTAEFHPKDDTTSGCVSCQECRAARALHFGRSNWLDLSSVDADLLSVVLGWGKIPEPIRKAIVALVEASR
jgi:hypothetical protein